MADRPNVLVKLECGHSFRTGRDDLPQAHVMKHILDPRIMDRYRPEDDWVMYACIKCQKRVRVVEWEGHDLADPGPIKTERRNY